MSHRPSCSSTAESQCNISGGGRERGKDFFFLMEELIGGRDKRREERERRMRQPTRG